MRIGEVFEYPPEQQQLRERTKKLSWLSVVLLLSAAVLLFFSLGQSQAMKTAWVSDVLTAIPPIALLVATKYELREPSERFPFGYTRSLAVAFLVTSGVLSLIGLFLLYDALSKLIGQQRPPIGTKELFGHQIWLGWIMVAALSYSLLCGLILGLLKTPVAKKLSDKALHAEATMNRDEWLSEGAAIVGIILVGFGHWWGDSVAAAFISLEIVHDGWLNMRLVVGDLMDESPTKMGTHDLEDIASKVRSHVCEKHGVKEADVRLREHGRAITGELLVVLDDGGDPPEQASEIGSAVYKVDWRLHDLVVVPVRELARTKPPRVVGSR